MTKRSAPPLAPRSVSEHHLSPSRVLKHDFKGSLPERPLYIYLPPGYDENTGTRYPVLYMHDGQNCFEAFAEDSFSGSWHADEVADALIAGERMRPCLIVGVGNGGAARLTEYLPPYSRLPLPHKRRALRRRRRRHVRGEADKTFAYYRDEVAPYIRGRFRILEGRDHTATCGSSMGGLFSTHIAFEHPEFAERHALMSPSYWMTENRWGELEMLARIKAGPVHDLRLWLDSGEGDGDSDDNKAVTLAAREALLEAGYVEGTHFVYHLAAGATHTEGAWAARLPTVFAHLFPPEESHAAPL